MIPTYITTHILKPGFDMEKKREVGGMILTVPDHNDGFAFVDNESHRIYSVDRKKVIDIDGIAIDAQGRLTETLFLFGDMVELEPVISPPDCGPWLCDWLGESGFEELDNENMAAIYGDADAMLQHRLGFEDGKSHREDILFTISFVAFWEVESSVDYESGVNEIDAINYIGMGNARLD